MVEPLVNEFFWNIRRYVLNSYNRFSSFPIVFNITHFGFEILVVRICYVANF